MSLISAIAALAYIITALLCCAAQAKVWFGRLRPRIGRLWWPAALLFAAMAVGRWFDIENTLRDGMREQLRAAGEYGSRWEVQAPVASLAVVLSAGLAVCIWKLWPRPGMPSPIKAARLAQAATVAFLPLIMMRLISFHPIDRLLYSGPVRFNWVADGVLTITVAACAAFYLVTRPPPQGQRPPGRQGPGERHRESRRQTP